MDSKLINFLEKTCISLIVIYIIGYIITVSDFLIFIYVPTAIISLIIFVVATFNMYLNSFEEDEDKKYKSYLKFIIFEIFTFEIIAIAVSQFLSINCGFVIITSIPVTVGTCLNLYLYFKIIKPQILKKKVSDGKIALYSLYLLGIMIFSIWIRFNIHVHPTVIASEE